MKQIADQLTSDGLIDCSELSELLPWVIRVIPDIDGEVEKLECRPACGEFSRFGVFFHALANEDQLKRFPETKPKIVLRTSDLLDSTGISRELKDRGILVFPSRQYSQEIVLAVPQNGSRLEKLCLGDQIGIDKSIQERHITLDVAGTCQGRLPILSIPERILISMDLIKK